MNRGRDRESELTVAIYKNASVNINNIVHKAFEQLSRLSFKVAFLSIQSETSDL